MNETIPDKTPKPAGLLPKHVQSWLIAGLAVLMVLVMWLTGAKRPPLPSKGSSLAPAPPPVEVNERKIAELQTRIQQLQREQSVAQSALAQQSRYVTAPETSSATPPARGPEQTEDAIQAERKKREYLSLFASNVAVSFRKNSQATVDAASDLQEQRLPTAVSPQVENSQIAELLKQLQPPFSPPQTAPVQAMSRSNSASSADTNHQSQQSPPTAAPAAIAAVGKSYVLFEGTVLEATLVNRLDGAMAGPVDCLLSGDVYSRDRQHVLIPAGSKVLGETRRVDSFGQARLAVVFHRLLMPDGFSVSLDQFKGLNQAGDVGLQDRVNNHYARIFGASLALGLIGAAAEAGTTGALVESGTDRLREGFGQSMALSSEHILDRFLNLLPTVTIREGHRVKIYLSGDLSLPDYRAHHLPSDL